MKQSVSVKIQAPNFQTVVFEIKGNMPLVIKRFDEKFTAEKDPNAKPGSGKKKVQPTQEEEYAKSKYVSKEGWEGFHAAAIRCGMISVCRLVGAKMTLAKMAIFVIADGVDAKQPQIPLVKIKGKSIKQVDIARVETGQPYPCVRAAYHEWSAKVKIRFDADQFSATDIANLLSRVGAQNGIGEGRPNSKNSAGMGWGTFDIVSDEIQK